MEKLNLWQRLANVQKELKAPKGQFNSFGKYKYRSAEDILEVAKPLCVDFGLLLTVSDELVLIGERYYIKATAKVINIDTGENYSVDSFAREEESKKGMDGSQVTGASSSYARKYALNGLFAIDDTKDSDTTNTHGKGEDKNKQMMQETGAAKIDKFKVKALLQLIDETGTTREAIEEYVKCKLEDMTFNKWGEIVATLEKRKQKGA
jgi:hypothetical protein